MYPIQKQVSFDASPVAILYDRYAHIILNYVSRHTASREDTDDLVLDVFLAALENQVWITWSDGEQLAWLRRIAHNKPVDNYRRATRHPAIALDNATHMLYEHDDCAPERIILRNEDHALLRAHLSP